MALAERGEAGYSEMIDHQTRMGEVFRELLEASGWRIVNSTPLPLLCFTRDGLAPSNFLESLRKHQIAWMSEAVLHGEPVIRACITSFRTTEDDIRWVVDQMNRIFLGHISATTEPAAGSTPRLSQPMSETAL
jgi:glutamate/tyrosine decarboxylase-like PLP-dependent enzyme